MTFILSQSFTFDAAHTLTRQVPLKEYQGSKRIHGHTYTASVSIQGQKGANGMVQVRKPGKRIAWLTVDLFVLRAELDAIRQQLDHRFLDEVEGIGPATLENLCVFISERVKCLPVHSVTVSRASGDSCTFTKDNT